MERSDRVNKKYKVSLVLPNGIKKTIHFGDSRYEDYTQHHDKARRDAYRRRHYKDTLHPEFPWTAGGLSWYILWGDSTDIRKNYRFFTTL